MITYFRDTDARDAAFAPTVVKYARFSVVAFDTVRMTRKIWAGVRTDANVLQRPVTGRTADLPEFCRKVLGGAETYTSVKVGSGGDATLWVAEVMGTIAAHVTHGAAYPTTTTALAYHQNPIPLITRSWMTWVYNGTFFAYDRGDLVIASPAYTEEIARVHVVVDPPIVKDNVLYVQHVPYHSAAAMYYVFPLLTPVPKSGRYTGRAVRSVTPAPPATESRRGILYGWPKESLPGDVAAYGDHVALAYHEGGDGAWFVLDPRLACVYLVDTRGRYGVVGTTVIPLDIDITPKSASTALRCVITVGGDKITIATSEYVWDVPYRPPVSLFRRSPTKLSDVEFSFAV